MNVVDSEVVVAILQKQDYQVTEQPEEADLVLINTCSIRDNAEQRVRARIHEFGARKQENPRLRVGVIGCMAERLKEKMLEEERSVDLVVGPDAYRELPHLLEEVESGQKGINTLLSLEETYADLNPVRLDKNHVSSFVSIMRGCNNFCAYCVVPYTRGRERSRNPDTIEREVRDLHRQGYKEVTLLGQNVNSYLWDPGRISEQGSSGDPPAGKQVSDSPETESSTQSPGHHTPLRFEALLERIAGIAPGLRVRFATSHPKDMSDELLQTIARYPNLCKSIHLPVQSGSTAVLERMKRGYTREMYTGRIEAIRKYLPGATISTDIIAGFCGETEADHQQTLSLMEWAGFDFAFMFQYSERPDTLAAKKYKDDVPGDVKKRRLHEIIDLQNRLSLESKKRDIGKTFTVLAEGTSKKSAEQLFGRTSQNKVVVFPAAEHRPGDYVDVRIADCTSATLLGKGV